MRRLLTWCAAATALLLIASCAPSSRKLDEVVFHDGPAFRLKVVRYHENYPLHYVGEVFRVQCASATTVGSPAHATQDSGWVTLGGGGAIGSRSAAELVARERPNYRALDDTTLVWTGVGLSVSRDACGSFRSWSPTAIPRAQVDTLPKPEHCAPVGRGDCRGYDFRGPGRAPQYADVRLTMDGGIAFTVRSTAIRGEGALRVASRDGGRTWSIAGLTPVSGAASDTVASP